MKRAFNLDEAAKYTGLPKGKLVFLQTTNHGPKFFKVATSEYPTSHRRETTLYLKESLDEWLDKAVSFYIEKTGGGK